MTGQLEQSLRNVYAALGTNIYAVLDMFDPDVELIQKAQQLDSAGTFKGHAGLVKSLAEIRQAFPDFSFELEELFDAGDGEHYVASLRLRGTGRGSGVAVDTNPGHFLTLRDGKIVRMEVFGTLDLALAAARIEAPASG